MMRTYKASRRELFESFDKPALAPLPTEPFEVSTWKKVGLNIDYHVAFEDHLYSAPHPLRHEDIELWLRVDISERHTSRSARQGPVSWSVGHRFHNRPANMNSPCIPPMSSSSLMPPCLWRSAVVAVEANVTPPIFSPRRRS